jgi:lambda family phage portal protein
LKEVARKKEMFETAVNYIAASVGKPVLFGPDNKPIVPSISYGYRRTAAKKSGSLKNWLPKRFNSEFEESGERDVIVGRSIDLVNNDPHAAGITDGIATTIVGSGLTPHPTLNQDFLKIDKEEIRRIQAEQRAVYATWSPFADAGQRMNFGAIQFMAQRQLMQYGEYLILLPMINDDPTRPYSLACQVINPLRLGTPVKKMNDTSIKNGVEVGNYGQPVAYWLEKGEQAAGRSRAVNDYVRIPARVGHRWNVLHGYVQNDADQYRGMPFFAPAMKFFRDLNDYLDAELVSNIVTAAFSLFIETAPGMDPYTQANLMQSLSGESVNNTNKVRYQEMVPGQIMYGQMNEKPHPIAANRPGSTFDPFVITIKKAMALALNMPYAVLFKDPQGLNFSGFRSALLDAWRVYTKGRVWLGQNFCQPIYTMLMEEAYLRGNINVQDFYTNMNPVTNAEWRGAPKGDIEPVQAVRADTLAITANLKTRAEAIAERGGDIRTTFDQLAEEQEMMRERGLTEQEVGDAGEGTGGGDQGSGAGVKGQGE